MPEPPDPHDEEAAQRRIRQQARAERYELTQHARQEMVSEETGRIRIEEMLQAAGRGVLLENYPEFYKGPCCLICGDTDAGRPLHVVCSTTLPELVFITVYEPTPPTWETPTTRSETP